MYDETVKPVELTTDEIDILRELLSYRLDRCGSIGEEITVKELLDKVQ